MASAADGDGVGTLGSLVSYDSALRLALRFCARWVGGSGLIATRLLRKGGSLWRLRGAGFGQRPAVLAPDRKCHHRESVRAAARAWVHGPGRVRRLADARARLHPHAAAKGWSRDSGCWLSDFGPGAGRHRADADLFAPRCGSGTGFGTSHHSGAKPLWRHRLLIRFASSPATQAQGRSGRAAVSTPKRATDSPTEQRPEPDRTTVETRRAVSEQGMVRGDAGLLSGRGNLRRVWRQWEKDGVEQFAFGFGTLASFGACCQQRGNPLVMVRPGWVSGARLRTADGVDGNVHGPVSRSAKVNGGRVCPAVHGLRRVSCPQAGVPGGRGGP